MKKRTLLKTLLIVFPLLIVVFALVVGSVHHITQNYYDSDYYYSKKLAEAIDEEDVAQVKEILRKKPSCVNTVPKLRPEWTYTLTETYPPTYSLYHACATDNIEIVKLLISAGANLDGIECVPLSVVYLHKSDNWYEISKLLIDSGASIDYVTHYSGGKSSILNDIVQCRAGAALPGYVPENEEEVNQAFCYALENCSHDNVDWAWAMQSSVTNNRIEIAKILLDGEYWKINDTNSRGMTALMFAARDSDEEMVQLLLGYGADKTITDEDGKTAYDYAVEYESDAAIVELLRP